VSACCCRSGSGRGQSLCARLGDRVTLKQFLTDRPGIDLDVKCPDGTTVLNEAVTKTAQFTGIVEVLLDFGARLDVSDSLGNSPLHNAVLYHPSTQDTVDLLLLRGADTGAKNYDEQTPVTMADDKDLKEVLKELKKGGGKKKVKGPVAPEKSREVAYSPDLRRKVTNSGGLDRLRPELLVVRFNHRPEPASPGLLKRRRITTEDDDGNRPRKRRRTDDGEDEKMYQRTKRIRWAEQDSTGAPIDPQFSEDDGETSEASNSLEDGGAESENIFPCRNAGLTMSDSADDPCRSESESGIENVDLLGNDNAILAEDITHLQSKEWSSSECSEAKERFTLLRSPREAYRSPDFNGDEKRELIEAVKAQDVSFESQRSREDLPYEDLESEDDDSNKFIQVNRVNQTSSDNQTTVKAKPSVSPEMLKRASDYVQSNTEGGELLSKRSRRDSNENMMLGSTKIEPLRIHMKANGDDSELDSDLSQDGSAPKVINFSGGFGFFVN